MRIYYAHKTGRGMYVKMYGRGSSVHRMKKMHGGSEELLLSTETAGSGVTTAVKIEQERPTMDKVIKKLEGLQMKTGVKRRNVSFQI